VTPNLPLEQPAVDPMAERALASSPRPRNVVLALRALWASVVLSILELSYAILDEPDGDIGFRWFLVGLIGMFALVFALPLYFLGRRHKWALYVVVSMSLAAVAVGYFIPETDLASWDMWLSQMAYSMLEVIGLALLSTKEAQAWFSRPSAAQGAP
jgi:hypothetical protein